MTLCYANHVAMIAIQVTAAHRVLITIKVYHHGLAVLKHSHFRRSPSPILQERMEAAEFADNSGAAAPLRETAPCLAQENPLFSRLIHHGPAVSVGRLNVAEYLPIEVLVRHGNVASEIGVHPDSITIVRNRTIGIASPFRFIGQQIFRQEVYIALFGEAVLPKRFSNSRDQPLCSLSVP